MTLDDNQAKSVAWAITSLKTVYGPNRPVHVEGHLKELQAMVTTWYQQQVMKRDILESKP
jgi:hypothetical protein